MNSALDDVAFLALSENRIALLEALSDEQRYSRGELMAATDVSRPTLARILNDLEARVWITQHGQTCRITPLGAWVYEEFTELLETIADEQRLREVVKWLPFDLMTFDVRNLRDATIVLSTETDPIAPIRHGEEVLQTGNQHRMLAYQVACDLSEVVAPHVFRGEKTFEGVITPNVYESLLSDSRTAASFRELLDADAANFLVVDDVDLILHIVDDCVCLGLADNQANPRALIVSENDAILAWAEETFDHHRNAAVPLTSEVLTS